MINANIYSVMTSASVIRKVNLV